jgi:hypothetical protein
MYVLPVIARQNSSSTGTVQEAGTETTVLSSQPNKMAG